MRFVLWDMDGVLVDVSGSYRRAIIETAERFLGKPVPPGLVQDFKNRGGYNNDWVLTKGIVDELGGVCEYEEVVAAFQELYVGRAGQFDGYIASEPPVMSADLLRRLGIARLCRAARVRQLDQGLGGADCGRWDRPRVRRLGQRR